MKNIKFLLAFLILTTFPAGRSVGNTSDAIPVSLDVAFDQARTYSARVKISDAELHAAGARFQQALGAVLPQISFKGSYFFQDDPGTSAAGVPNSFVRTERPEAAINGKWLLFQGLKEYQAFSLNGVDKDQQRQRKYDAERLLFRDVAIAYFTIARIEQDIATIEQINGVQRDRVTELNRRLNLGKSRLSEKLSQETDLQLLEAELYRLQGERQAAYELLSYLTGVRPQPRIAWDGSAAQPLAALDDYLKTLPYRPDLVATRYDVDIARANYKIDRGDLLPQLEADGNYYLYRVGFQEDINWDATLLLTVPLFNWEDFGRARESSIAANAAELLYIDARRTAENDVRQAWLTYDSDVRQLEKYNAAASNAEKAYKSDSADFRRGLVNNLEVMQAQRTWFEAMRQRNAARAQSWIDWIVLQVNAGQLPIAYQGSKP